MCILTVLIIRCVCQFIVCIVFILLGSRLLCVSFPCFWGFLFLVNNLLVEWLCWLVWVEVWCNMALQFFFGFFG